MSQPLEVTDPADTKEAEEWGKAAKHMLSGGGPDGEPEQAGSDEPEVREFRYRGRTIKVDADTYGVLEDLRKEARSGNGRVGSELARTKERLARMEAIIAARETPQQPEPEIAPPDPMLATRDIAAWQRQYDAYRDAKEARRIEQIERRHAESSSQAEERAEQQRRDKEWADRFYETYDHLDDPAIKPIVAQAFVENKAEIDAFGDDVSGAYDRLAELADERLVRLKNAGKAAANPNDNRRRLPTLESSAAPTPRKPAEPDESRRDFSAGSWVARERLRMQGRTPRK